MCIIARISSAENTSDQQMLLTKSTISLIYDPFYFQVFLVVVLIVLLISESLPFQVLFLPFYSFLTFSLLIKLTFIKISFPGVIILFLYKKRKNSLLHRDRKVAWLSPNNPIKKMQLVDIVYVPIMLLLYDRNFMIIQHFIKININININVIPFLCEQKIPVTPH